MENFSKMKELINATEADASAFFGKGNKSAGTRVRNAMQQLKELAQSVRTEVLEKRSESK
ncbi:histone H1 [Mucilaginibacter sp. SP1R1]|uniref:histone H1 n=1 Tax=Mucilaginibacter sp. SP1R1 TaxID=2723091 RepID=UPI00160E71A0|nr:histone H1 [Mucilaginibacter sp. SP1R1]MBB6148291.1 hypothetical protein [Mucilaginibacter sp. SP1R1]